jgi:tetratricopeptide (TPR) repeat protein
LVAVRIFAVIFFGAAMAFGVWATATGNSVLFGRLTALAGVFSLVLAAAVAAMAMIAWTMRQRSSSIAGQGGQVLQQTVEQRAPTTATPPTAPTVPAANVQAGREANVAGRDIIVNQAARDPIVAPPKPGMLPRDVTDFIGRSDELARLTALADSGSLKIALIYGVAGVGKTTLALHAAHQLKADFPGGHLYADLLAYTPGRNADSKPTDPGEVLENFLRLLDVSAADMPAETRDKSSLFRQLLESRRALLVLDNVSAEGQVEPLLPGTGQTVVFITSRETLSGLSPPPHVRILLDVFSPQEADGLLRSLMGSARAEAEPTQVAKIRDLCGRLPLALWIAGQLLATRPNWTAGTLVKKLRSEPQRLERLTSGDKKVRAAFAMSYKQLASDYQLMFRLLGLHPGPQFDVLAAASLADIAPTAAEHALERLEQAHLITEYSADRFGMHDLLRLFAREMCEETDDPDQLDAARTRLVAHYAHVATRLADLIDGQAGLPTTGVPRQEVSASRQEALTLFESERSAMISTLHLAIGWSVDEEGWQLCTGLRKPLRRLRYLEDLSGVLQDSLAIARRSLDAEARCSILEELGLVCRELQRPDEAITWYREALAGRRGIGHTEGEALTLNALGAAYLDNGEVNTAVGAYQEALALCQETGNPGNVTGKIHNNLGLAYAGQQRLDEALAAFQQALNLSKGACDHHTAAQALCNLGDTQRLVQRLDDAVNSYAEALNFCQQAGDQGDGTAAQILYGLGHAYQAQAELLNAADTYEQARTIYRYIEDRRAEAEVLGSLGDTYRKLQRHDEAISRYRESLAIYQGHLEARRDRSDLEGAAAILQRLGGTYREKGDFRESVAAYDQSRTIEEEIGE